MPRKIRMMTLLVAVGGVLAGSPGTRPAAAADDDGRPIIIVKGGSIEFNSPEGWDQLGSSRQWRQRAKAGAAVSGFRAEALDAKGNVACSVPTLAAPMRVEFQRAQPPGTLTFSLTDAGNNTLLAAPEPLVQAGANGEILRYSAAGTVATVGNTPGKSCAVPPGGTAKVYGPK